MSPSEGMTFVLATAIVAIAAITYALIRKRRSERLRERFGPEYDRVVRREGVRKAEAVLAFRQKRRQKLAICSLSRTDRSRFLQRWNEAENRFVDDPKDAVIRADSLVTEVMQAHGYPIADFEQRVADLSVDHPAMVENYRAAHEIALRSNRGQTSTEELRRAIVHYRALLQELLDDQPQRRSA
jgi:hypothetical protein